MQYNTSCKFVQIGKMYKVCSYFTAMQFKGDVPGMCCASGKVKLPKLE